MSCRLSVSLLLIVVLLSVWVSEHDNGVEAAGRDFYKILGLKRNSNAKQVKKAYLKLSKEFHPDKNPGNEEANKRFVEVANAYEVLSDENKRRIYDQQGEDGLKQSGQPQQSMNPFDLFGQMFGHPQQQAQGERRGQDVTIELPVTLADLYNGRIFEVLVKQQQLCPHCRGTGAKSENDAQVCSACQGRGVRVHMHQIAPGFVQQVQQTCDVCGGKGKIIRHKCPVCGGAKVMPGTKTLDVTVEKGMADGAKIEFENSADENPDVAAGHVIFTIVTQPHANFTRKGDDLFLDYHISLLEALVGFRRSIPHLDGHDVLIASNKITQPNEVMRVKEEGMPKHESGSERGDLHIKFIIDFPAVLSAEQRAGFAQIFK